MVKKAPEKIGFGGGCHWCTEAVFQALNGVNFVEQGYISSSEPYAEFSEGVIVHYDPEIIELFVLISIHLETHSSSSAHGMRNKYRSAIYFFTRDQEREVSHNLNVINNNSSKKIITEVLPFRKFEPSLSEFRNYYINDPGKPFCKTYIVPKIEFLKEKYPDRIKDGIRKL